MIPLFVLALLSLIASTSAQCTSYPDNFGQYAVSLCPLPSNQRTPPVITSPTVWVPTGSVDLSVSTQFTLAFPVMIYGVAHSQFFFNTNGALFFGTTGITSDTLTLPLSASNTDALPVIAPLWVDQYMVPGVASGVFGTIGAVGNRTQIIRFINNPYDEPFRSTTNFTYDVVFYEAQPNVMEFRYYSLLNVATWTKSLTIGIQSFDDGGVVHTIVSGSTQWAVNQPLLNGNMITYRYVGTPTSEERCSGLGYDFESIRGTQLNYTDASGVTWLYSPCGRVTDARCAGNPATDKAMVCQIPVTGTPVDLGIYGPGVVDYQYPAGAQTGVEAVFQSGSYCSSITASRLTYVSYECDATATTPSFYAATTPSTCVYRLNIRTNLACGGGARGNDTQYLYPPSTLPFCNRVTGAAYDAILCPQSAAQRRAPEYPAMTPILQNVGTGTLAVTLQFPFWFYGNNYTTAYVSMNGAIYFGATSTATPGTAPTMGFTNPNTFPAIFAFGTSMSALNYAGLNPANITHTHTMINGRRAFVARYWDMKYTSSRGLFDVVMSFDIVLTEAPANRPAAVEIKYYRVTPSNTNNVQIGIHGPYSMDVYTSYSNNVAMNGVLANQLQGAMLSYNYTGRTLVDACVGYGIDFSTVITSDLQVTDGAYTYVVNPCGALRSTAACPAGTTVCQIPNGQTTGGFVLGVANPAAVTWSQSPGSVLGIRSTINSGAFCTVNQQARMVNLDWVCSRTVSVPTLVSMQELSTCTYTGVIYTPQVCTSPLACTTISAVAYRGEFCPVTSPKVVQTSPVRIFTAQEDDDAIRITLPFEMMFYGQYYRYVWIGTNGLLAFGPSRPTIIGQRLPVTGSNLDYTPIIAGFWSDLEIIEQSYVSWSVNTINGRRAVVIRYENVEFYGSTTAGVGDAVSFDVLLWEGQSGDIEVRYFTVNVPTSSSSFSVGIQGDDIDPEEAIIFSSLQPVNAAFAASYSNSTLKFTYTGPAPSSIPCAGLGYNFTALRNTQLVFNTSTTVSFVVNICNIVQDPVCSNSVLTDRSMVCRRTQAATAATATLASIGEWNPSEVWWRYAAGSTGVQLVSQTGVYCSAAAQPYTTILNFVCLATATTPTVTGILESPTCFVTINITTSLACGAGDRGLPAPIVNSTLPTCVPITGNLYNAVWCPRAANDPLNTPEVLVNPVNTLMTDNGAAIATFGFNFTIYGRQEAQVSISSNGVLTFGYTAHAAAANGAFPSMGLTADHYPAVAAFFTDLINVQQAADPLAYNGVIQVAWSGTSPNRRMIIRYQNIDYFLTRNSLAAQTASFDIVLYESNTGSRIDVRYYKIDAAPQYVVIGMHGYGQDYTQVTNLVPIGRSLSSQLSGSTLTYTWTGAATINACSNVPGGINLLQLSNQDIAFNSTSYAFFVRPCGIVSAPLCANRYTTSRVSVCQASFDGTNSWALASDNAAATVYTLVNATTLRATTNDGLLCGADPRRTVIDYVCNRAATTPFIDQQSENPGCTYNFRVQTVAACVNPVTIPGTAVGSPAVYYNAVVNQFDELPATKPTLTSPTTLALTDDDLGAVTSPFPIRVFGNTTTSLSVSANGFIGFTAATSPTGVPSVGFPLSSNYNPALPVLAVWTSDLHNSNKIGTAGILWAVQGTTPNRVLIIRYNDVNYYTNRQASTNPDSLLTFDVRLYESSNNIDVQYWAIGSYAQNVAVGIQGMTGSSTVLINAQSYAARGLYLQDRTVRYVYVDPAAPSSSSTGVAPSSSAVPSSSPVVPSSTVAPTSSARSSSSSSSSVAPSSTAPVATSSPIVTSSARSSSSSAPVTPTSAPVTPSTAAARSSSSSSSSSAAARSSSSSAVPVGSSSAGVSSSAGPSPSGPWPANSVRVTMNVVLPQPISASNYETIKSQLESDIIQNIADATGVSTSQLTGQVAVGSIGGLTSGARRLLQTETPVVFVILGTISDAVTGLGVDAAQVARNVANTLSTRVSEQRFTTTNSGATVPSGQSLSIAPAEGGDFGEGDSSSSSSLSDGAIAGIVIGSVVGGILLCVVLAALVLGWGRGNKHSTRMDDHSSHGPTDVELA